MLQELACVDNREEFSLWRRPIGRGSQRDLVHAAVLAASAHNSQPWRFALFEGGIDVHADLSRHLGSFDPFRRELFQSLGCAIENLAQAALAQGLEARVEAFPSALPVKPGDTLAARIRFAPATRADTKLFQAIPRRRTNRGAYDPTRTLPEGLGDELMALIAHPRLRLILFDATRQAELGELIVQSTRWIVEDREMAADNAKWFRFLYFDVRDKPDG